MVYKIEGMGWIPDPPSSEDFCPESAQVAELIGNFYPGLAGAVQSSSLKQVADISQYDALIKDQTNIGGCVGMGTTAAMESRIRKETGLDIVLSARYCYKTTRYKMGPFYEQNDTGAFIRAGFGAANTHGCPPEENWPWVSKLSERDPNNYLIGSNHLDWNAIPHPLVIPYAMNYRIRKYARLDPNGYLPNETLIKIKQSIAVDENPVCFGFTCFTSLNSSETTRTGLIPFRRPGDRIIGGHCMLAVGYDDNKKIGNSYGALKCKNSWSTQWGEKGYAWLPYDYVLQGAAADFWTILAIDFSEIKPFQA